MLVGNSEDRTALFWYVPVRVSICRAFLKEGSRKDLIQNSLNWFNSAT